MASSSSSNSAPLPIPHANFEDELASDLEKDDSAILEKRFNVHANIRKLQKSIDRKTFQRIIKNQTQWTRALDAVQEHFSSHVTIDGSSYRLPHKLYALKTSAKHSWILYKKRECERRKRIRQRLEREKTREQQGNPANILLAMVDSCEACKRLYVTVNLFWGATLCDACYFNPEVITKIMEEKTEMADKSLDITPDNIVEEVLQAQKSSNAFFFNPAITSPPPIPPPKEVRKAILTSDEAESSGPVDEPAVLDTPPSSPLTQSPDIRYNPPPLTEDEITHMLEGQPRSYFFPSQLSQFSQFSQFSLRLDEDDEDTPNTPYNHDGDDPLDNPGTQQ